MISMRAGGGSTAQDCSFLPSLFTVSPFYSGLLKIAITKLSRSVGAAHLWSVSVIRLMIPLRIQVNTMLFAKTLVRKDIASTASSTQARDRTKTGGNASSDNEQSPGEASETSGEESSSKAQVHTLMTTDVDRVAGFHFHFHPWVFAWYLVSILCLCRRAVVCLTLRSRLLSECISCILCSVNLCCVTLNDWFLNGLF